jgi:hypothetical protein
VLSLAARPSAAREKKPSTRASARLIAGFVLAMDE